MSSEHDNPTVAAGVGLTGVATIASESGAVSAPPGTPSTRRFEPGSIIAGRYRLVAMLGRGGMGEVYRADDLTLDQPVALKFLPLSVGADERSLARFHNELRVARQVSHRNVCRLYDVGEADGHRFLTMEYIDGEDLGSLLRRIGRLPQDKAVQIARQLCAGVAAAHERGVLHRDLKPANVMIDGQGDARITDFGIATATADGAQEVAGTPQYMAPELFAGRPASVQSDVYALGLTLYELFTGKRAWDSTTIAELKALHESGTVTNPTTVVRDLDPRVERVILRCLEKDAGRRPASALAVAAMLPGADALADALAAGETPSPELLAAAGESLALPVWRGVVAVALVVASVLVFATLSGRLSVFGRAPHDLPPVVLADRAKAIVQAAGYTEAPVDEAYELTAASGFVNWLRNESTSPTRLDGLANGRPSGTNFWYRGSPRELVTLSGDTPEAADPPLQLTNMTFVLLDGAGRLQEFRAVPPQKDDRTADAPAPDWAPLFRAAALDASSFTAVPPQWTPRDFADTRFAWEGPYPGLDDKPLRIEASSYRGRPVSFALVAPWTEPTLMVAREQDPIDRIFIIGAVIFFCGVSVAAVLLARSNVRQARADVQGALRVGMAIGAVLLLSWIPAAMYTGTTVIESHFQAAGAAALYGVMVWVLYLALEPYARRFWPHSLLGWSRLLAGHLRDPRVGRDILAGMLLGILLAYLDVLRSVVMPALGFRAPQPVFGTALNVLLGTGPLASAWMGWLFSGLLGALIVVLGLVLARLLLRKAWLAIAVASLLLSLSGATFMGSSSLWMIAFPIAQGIAIASGTVWLGLLPLVVARLVWWVLNRVPFTGDVSGWASAPGNWSIAILVALAFFGYYASRAGQPLFGRMLDDRSG